MIKTVKFVFAWVFLWFLTTVITRQIWLFPVLFFVLCGYVIYDERKKRKAKLAADIAERQRIAREQVQETQVRLATECRAADATENGDLCILTEDGIRMFCNPN
jgi:hypothetical protein